MVGENNVDFQIPESWKWYDQVETFLKMDSWSDKRTGEASQVRNNDEKSETDIDDIEHIVGY